MNTRILLLAALSVSILSFAGCDGSRGNDYPDRSATTTRRVDDIKRNARDQKDAVDVEAERIATKLDFDERQIREKYRAQRQSFANTTGGDTTDREARNREILIQAKHDRDVIDAEVAEKLRTSPPEKAAEIQADALSRKSAIDSRTTSRLAPIASDTQRNNAKDIQRGIDIDRDEAREISALEQERSKAMNATKEKKLKIDQWTNDELAKVEKDTRSTGK